MPYLLDADWIVHALAGRPLAVGVLDQLAPQGVFVSLITVAEVYEGAFRSSNPEAHLEKFRRFLRPFHPLNLNEPIAEIFAEISSPCAAEAN